MPMARGAWRVANHRQAQLARLLDRKVVRSCRRTYRGSACVCHASRTRSRTVVGRACPRGANQCAWLALCRVRVHRSAEAAHSERALMRSV